LRKKRADKTIKGTLGENIAANPQRPKTVFDEASVKSHVEQYVLNMWADEADIYEFEGKKSEILKTGNYTQVLHCFIMVFLAQKTKFLFKVELGELKFFKFNPCNKILSNNYLILCKYFLIKYLFLE